MTFTNRHVDNQNPTNILLIALITLMARAIRITKIGGYFYNNSNKLWNNQGLKSKTYSYAFITMTNHGKHENYEILNLIGYGLAKFNMDFVKAFGFDSKTAFHQFIVENEIAATIGTVKNRQDLFDPFFDNGRKGWWQKGDTYIHRKNSIDAFFETLGADEYTDVVKMHLKENYAIENLSTTASVSPVRKSQFKKLQETGYGAELFFIKHYQSIAPFTNGVLEDARMLGDGYDFQVSADKRFFLAEIKGIHEKFGAFRMTRNEFSKAKEYQDTYALIIVANLSETPLMRTYFHPTKHFDFSKKTTESKQISYHAKYNANI